jgi:hypothetical protein
MTKYRSIKIFLFISNRKCNSSKKECKNHDRFADLGMAIAELDHGLAG